MNKNQERIAELEPIERQLYSEMERMEDAFKDARKKWHTVYVELDHLRQKEKLRQEILAEQGEITPIGPATPMPELPVIKPITTQLAYVSTGQKAAEEIHDAMSKAYNARPDPNAPGSPKEVLP